jgi:Domain of unknown function (DUF4157)
LTLSRVRAHRDAEAADLARSVGARAFTVGEDVFSRDGEYQPHTRDGPLLLARELVPPARNGWSPRRRRPRHRPPDRVRVRTRLQITVGYVRRLAAEELATSQ